MNKPFLLIVGEYDDEKRGTSHWILCFKTEEEAESYYYNMDRRNDWYQIVDLRDWAN
jgi:hypothetical protein